MGHELSRLHRYRHSGGLLRDVWCLGCTLFAFLLFLWAKQAVVPGWHGVVTFDGMFYMRIGESGYAFDGDILHKQNTAFLPLMGWAIEAARTVVPGENSWLEVALLGLPILFLTLVGLYRLTRTVASEAVARVAVLLWAFSPLAFYNFTGYGDPMYALLTAWTLLFALERRFWPACVLAGLAMLVRPQAAILVAFVAIALLWPWRAKWKDLLSTAVPLQLALMVLPIMAFATYGALLFGDSTVYIHSLEAWRRGSLADGNLPVWEAVHYFILAASTGGEALSSWTAMLAALGLGVVFGVLAFGLGGPRPISAFYLASLLFLLASNSFDGLNFARHVLFMAPWVVLAAIAQEKVVRNAWARVLVLLPWLVFASAVNLAAVGRYYRGEWVS